MALYNKHRPKAIKALVGSPAVLSTLSALMARPNGERPHALLIVGPSGCGKTTVARIYAKSVGAAGDDVQELNIADMRGIDTVRELSRMSSYKPMQSDARFIILDEIQSMTSDAQNALLKLLEEPPAHLYFALCTTNPEKLLKTVVTRCTTITMAALSPDHLVSLMERVLEREKKKIPREVLDQIATDAEGSGRQALSILEKVLDLPEKDMLEAAKQQAVTSVESIELCRAMLNGAPWEKVAGILKNLEGDPERARRAILGYAQSILLGCKGKPARIHNRAYLVIETFRQNLFDAGKPGLVASCWAAATTP